MNLIIPDEESVFFLSHDWTIKLNYDKYSLNLIESLGYKIVYSRKFVEDHPHSCIEEGNILFIKNKEILTKFHITIPSGSSIAVLKIAKIENRSKKIGMKILKSSNSKLENQSLYIERAIFNKEAKGEWDWQTIEGYKTQLDIINGQDEEEKKIHDYDDIPF